MQKKIKQTRDWYVRVTHKSQHKLSETFEKKYSWEMTAEIECYVGFFPDEMNTYQRQNLQFYAIDILKLIVLHE